MLLQDKVAIVTGAATGIGEGIAQLFVSEGAHVFMLDRDTARNEEAARALPGKATAIACDVRDSKQIQNAVDAAMQQFGRIDILINNAGIYPRQAFLGMTEEQWDEMQNTNLKSIFFFCRAVLPHMTKQGSGKVVNISSVTFHVGSPNLSHYVSSKGGVIGFTRSVAREMGSHGVSINCITPGAILVEAEKKVATEEQIQAILELQSIKRRLVPLDIARVCVFLSSELSDGMTGQTLNVDGGWVMY
jgi:3-oxoacyl-[acyl-carrier protein] reductase